MLIRKKNRETQIMSALRHGDQLVDSWQEDNIIPNRCQHGILIKNEEKYSQYCSVCQSLYMLEIKGLTIGAENI